MKRGLAASTWSVYSIFPANLMRTLAGVFVAMTSAVRTSCWVPSMSNCRVAPLLRTSMVTGAPITKGRFTSP